MRRAERERQYFDQMAEEQAFHLWDDTTKTRQERRALRARLAQIFFTEPNILNPFFFLEKKVGFYKQRMRNSPDETAFLRWPLKARLLEAGFKKVEVRPFDFLHPDTPETLLPLFSRLSSLLEKLPIVKEIAANLIVFGVKG